MSQALTGIKVIDISQVAAVPMCARHLGDLGADVIHVEHPVRGDLWRATQAGHGGEVAAPSPINYIWEHYNRNKKGIAVDLSQPAGQKIIHQLVATADVFLTNLRLWEREAFRVSYNVLSEINPRLIYGSLTGLGKNGPDRNEPAYDYTTYWWRVGIPLLLRTDNPPAVGFRAAIGDNPTAMALAFGVMSALFVRERTGLGQEVDVSLLDAGMYQMTVDVAAALTTGQDYSDYGRFGTDRQINPLVTFYPTKDGRLLGLYITRPDIHLARFLRAIGHPELESDSRFATIEARKENRQALIQILQEVLGTKTLAEWREILRGIPLTFRQTLPELVNDPQARENGSIVQFDHPVHGPIEVLNSPVKLDKTPATIRTAAPEFSQHTEEVLLELGYTWDEIADLKEKQIIP